MKVYTTNDICIDELDFSKPKQNSMGGQHIFVNIPNTIQEESKIRFQTPVCNLPFGMNEYKGKYNLDLQLNDDDIKEFLTDFDKKIIETASTNSFSWFKKSMHASVIKELFRPQMKQNGKYPPLFRVKIPLKNNEFDGKVFNNKQLTRRSATR